MNHNRDAAGPNDGPEGHDRLKRAVPGHNYPVPALKTPLDKVSGQRGYGAVQFAKRETPSSGRKRLLIRVAARRLAYVVVQSRDTLRHGCVSC